MPYKHTEYKIPKTKDRRVKLTDGQKKIIKDMYKSGEYSQRMLAREFNVSRRTIQFIIDPKKRELNYQTRKDRGGSKQYYDKDKHSEAMRKHRQYKQELYIKGELDGKVC